MKKDHILVIRFSSLGDVAMAVPVVYSLAHQHPEIRITVLSRGFARPLFEGLAPNVGFMEADLKHEYHGIRGLNALYRRLVAKQFTAVADLHNVLRSDFLRLRFNLGRYRVAHINKHRLGRRRLVSASNKKLVQQPTSFQNYVEVFERLGYSVNIQFTSIFPKGGGDLNLLPPAVISHFSFHISHFYIGLAPFAAHQGKVYPPHLMQEVIEQLSGQHPESRIFLFGRGAEEDKWFSKWCQKYPACVSVGQHLTTLQQELILMSHLDVMVSMDSANMHLASLTGIPVVSIWGATHPYAGFMGWRQSQSNAIQLPMDCRPCSIFGQKPCRRGDYACLNNIRPETIVEKINTILLTKNK
jgi:ADP-heptose:LPS heptosyltransferase